MSPLGLIISTRFEGELTMANETIKMLSVGDKSLTSDLHEASYQKMGIVVIHAVTFQETTKILEKDTIHLIMINKDNPQIKPLDTVKYLREQPEFKIIPIIVTGVQASKKHQKAFTDAGADLFIVQPIARNKLLKSIKLILDQKTREQSRIDILSKASFELNGRSIICSILDLSISGLLISYNKQIKEGACLSLKFKLPQDKNAIRIEGEVVRNIEIGEKYAGHKNGVGIRFTKFHLDSEKKIKRFVENTQDDVVDEIYYL